MASCEAARDKVAPTGVRWMDLAHFWEEKSRNGIGIGVAKRWKDREKTGQNMRERDQAGSLKESCND